MLARTEALIDVALRWGLVAIAVLGAAGAVHAYVQMGRVLLLRLVAP